MKVLKIDYLQECHCFHLKRGKKLCTIAPFYRSPSQSGNEFANFLNNLNLTLTLTLLLFNSLKFLTLVLIYFFQIKK